MSSSSGLPSRHRRTLALAGLAWPAALVLAAGCAHAGAGRAAPRSPLQRAYQSTIRKALPSVVEIDSGGSAGSGVVFDARGDIVTNAHVTGTEKKFEVRTSVISQALPARLVGAFPPDDLAVIRVTRHAGWLRPARWADSAKAQIGQLVLAMGSPYGLTDSVTQGIVSATGRIVTGPAVHGKSPAVIRDAIQTSAAINPGNSGGALVLLSGFVLGIPTLSAQDPEQGGAANGIGFAIPSNTVVDIARQLISTGKVTRSDRASLQLTGVTHLGSSAQPDGVTVEEVAPGGAAAAAGIRPGDVIAGIGGQPAPGLSQLDDMLAGYRPGETVTVEVLRNGSPRQVRATLGSLGG